MTSCLACVDDWREYRRMIRDARTQHAEGQPVDVVAVDMAKTLAESCTHPPLAAVNDPIAALVAERFGPATPPAPRLTKAPAEAIAALLADLDRTDHGPLKRSRLRDRLT
jgi:hypothetical protein